MLNRLFFALTLILSFGMAQIGAVTHEISHYSDIYAKAQNSAADKSSLKPGKSSEPITHHQVCEKCIGYAQLGHMANGTQMPLPAIDASTIFYSPVGLNTPYAKLRTYSARAPPSFV